MRRLLLWITPLTICASLLLLGVRIVRPTPDTTACVQLLSPTTGDVLTVDMSTESVALDARKAFPIPLPTPVTSYYAPFSPDQTRVIEAASVGEGPPAFKLTIRKPSTTYRRLLTPNSFAERFTWSPDSHFIAFTEMRGWGANGPVVNLAIADAATSHVNREVIAESLDDGWFNRTREFVWSPDSTRVALAMYRLNVGSTLALRSPESDQSTYVSLPNEQIIYVSWSPNSQVLVVVTVGSTGNTLFVFQRDGQLIKQTAFYPNFNPYLVTPETDGSRLLQWSPDGQYFFFTENTADKVRIDIYNLNGDRQLAAPQVVKRSILWASQPHTLLYMVERADHQALYALDASTGLATILLDDIPLRQTMSLAPDSSSFAIITSIAPNQFLLHLLSIDLNQNIALFGAIMSQGNVRTQWSPDSQQLLIMMENDTTYTLKWANKNGSGLHQAQFPKQLAPDEQLVPSWRDNDTVTLVHIAFGSQTIWRLDARSAVMTVLFPPADFDNRIIWADDAYMMRGTTDDMNLYRLDDGKLLFSKLPYKGGLVTAYIEASERALLLFSARASDAPYPTLYLITNYSMLSLASTYTLGLTQPAWSPDGEMFTYAAKDDFASDWHLKVMSRDGTLLKDLPINLAGDWYTRGNVRWTNCD